MYHKKRIGIYCNPLAVPPIETITEIASLIKGHGGKVILHKPIAENAVMSDLKNDFDTFSTAQEAEDKIDVLFSIGGDGTFLSTVPLVLKGNIPVIGINAGRLGFLSNVAQDQTEFAINNWLEGNYTIFERTLLEVVTPSLNGSAPKTCALNDITIRRTDSANMMSFNVDIDGEFLNNYWADGVIFATATGSTAYSLSCGGPILHPNTQAFIVTPIASHNLTVRPLVISDNSLITISTSGRSDHFSLSIDSENYNISTKETVTLKKSSQTIKTVIFKKMSFYDSIRDKLSWGIDKRN